jgi:hypothetical protein
MAGVAVGRSFIPALKMPSLVSKSASGFCPAWQAESANKQDAYATFRFDILLV